jgi:tyrosine-protein phosphatase YwqE
MISLFRKKIKSYGDIQPLVVDIHSHLLPGIDDGCKTMKDSIGLVKKFADLGYKKMILTPHVMNDFYPNTPEIIADKLDKLKDVIQSLGIKIELEAAAEYYLDEFFMERLEKEEKLLSFGAKKYVLFETSFLNASPYLNQAIFMMRSLGYTPILAHPERYVYLFGEQRKIAKLKETGVLFQIEINSLGGYYSGHSKKIAQWLVDEKMVDFLGSDCHHENHFNLTKTLQYKSSYYKKALQLDLLNNTLLD